MPIASILLFVLSGLTAFFTYGFCIAVKTGCALLRMFRVSLIGLRSGVLSLFLRLEWLVAEARLLILVSVVFI
jgi:hypothetical protein